jgi:hypothetical protein
MPLSLLNHSALALFAQRTRIPTSARSIGFCAIWVCISSSSSSTGLSVLRFGNGVSQLSPLRPVPEANQKPGRGYCLMQAKGRD